MSKIMAYSYREYREEFAHVHFKGNESDPKDGMSIKNYLDRLYLVALTKGYNQGLTTANENWKGKLSDLLTGKAFEDEE